MGQRQLDGREEDEQELRKLPPDLEGRSHAKLERLSKVVFFFVRNFLTFFQIGLA